ncbi:MAG: bifunctional glutamate N-acetyltransferase/amino-acid acetyltransferase ArgJ [Gammaproteobacteria bacterium]|nr:bifunctional glutamate N-acetyltransferase/amino-acid acetyltransferase ArgJ [Gammaproteobacteria bacterium]
MTKIDKQDIQREYASMQPVAGVRLGSAAAGIRYKGRDDIVLFELCDTAQTAAMFTTNVFCAAPVVIAKNNLANASPRYLLVNAGNANAGTGQQGMDDANACCHAIAELAECEAEQVLPFSTGVIGQYLPVGKIVKALPAALDNLREDNWLSAARTIMTTDTAPKGVTRKAVIDGHEITVTGIAKGAGMICPNMATLLSYVATDAALPAALLQATLAQAVNKTFNRITVDGDTSTNDACVLMATGKSSLPLIDGIGNPNYNRMLNLVTEVFEFLAKAIIRDAEGATKLVNVTVTQGASENECKQVAYTIAHSPLVKTALFASDPNWGRILAAVGRAGVSKLDIRKVKIELNGVCIVSNGGVDATYTEALGQQAMQPADIEINVALGRGSATANVWTCDFSYDYVKINAEYRT